MKNLRRIKLKKTFQFEVIFSNKIGTESEKKRSWVVLVFFHGKSKNRSVSERNEGKKKIKPAPNWTSSSYKRRPGKKRKSRCIQ
jgi:hypothetical protein